MQWENKRASSKIYILFRSLFSSRASIKTSQTPPHLATLPLAPPKHQNFPSQSEHWVAAGIFLDIYHTKIVYKVYKLTNQILFFQTLNSSIFSKGGPQKTWYFKELFPNWGVNSPNLDVTPILLTSSLFVLPLFLYLVAEIEF